MLIVIGPRWHELLLQRRRRWYQPTMKDDYVALEIMAALEMKIPIVPVLFDGASMPKENALPKFMWPIAKLNAAIVGDSQVFRDGADAICDQVARIRSSLHQSS